MGCFDNIIGIGGCEEVTATSGIYLRDTGISIDDLGYLLGSDYSDGITMANDKITFATKLVLNEISANFSSKYIPHSFLEENRIGFFQENKPSKTGANEIRGIDLVARHGNSYFDFYIDKIQLHLNYTGDVVINIYDVIQNKVLDTFTVSVVTGVIKEQIINKTYKSEKRKLHLFIGYNANGIASYETTLTNGGGCSTCELGNYQPMNAFISAKSSYISGSDVIDQNIYGLSHTSGISLLYSVKCDHESWLCRYKNEIALAISYKACAEIVQYGLYQGVGSNKKTFDPELLKERWNYYDSMYRKTFKNVVQNINLPNDENCFQCKKITTTKIALP